MPGARIVIEDFGGRAPRRAARLLPSNFAQVAENCKLLYGDLRGYQDFRLVHEFPTGTLPRRVWHLKNTAQTEEAWYGDRDPKAVLLKSPIVNDAYERYYLFREGQPPKITTFDDIKNGVPPSNLAFGQPVNAPTVTPSGGSSSNLTTRVYGYTYVTSWGEESRLSPVTAADVKTDVTSITVTVSVGAPPPAIAGRTFQYIRLYRSVTSAGGAQLYFLADIPYSISGGSYVDTQKDLEVVLNSPLVSSQNDPIPDGVWGARVMGNGAMVGFKGRDLYFSVPYLPHAWPEDWRLTVSDLIVGVEVMGQNVMVMTQGFPVYVYGSYPDAMGMLRFDFPEPCIAYGSIVAAPEGIYFGSYNGLCLFTTAGVSNITREMISRNDWRNQYLDVETRAERLTTRYIASTSNAGGYVIDGLEERIALTDLVGWLTVGDISSDVFTSDVLAISFDAVYVWDDPDALEIDYRWRSKKFVFTKPCSMGALMLHLDACDEEEWLPTPILNPGYEYPEGMDKTCSMLVKVWRDGKLIFNRPVHDREQCRLDSDTVGTVWEVEVQGQCRVQRIAIVETGHALEEA